MLQVDEWELLCRDFCRASSYRDCCFLSDCLLRVLPILINQLTLTKKTLSHALPQAAHLLILLTVQDSILSLVIVLTSWRTAV